MVVCTHISLTLLIQRNRKQVIEVAIKILCTSANSSNVCLSLVSASSSSLSSCSIVRCHTTYIQYVSSAFSITEWAAPNEYCYYKTHPLNIVKFSYMVNRLIRRFSTSRIIIFNLNYLIWNGFNINSSKTVDEPIFYPLKYQKSTTSRIHIIRYFTNPEASSKSTGSWHTIYTNPIYFRFFLLLPFFFSRYILTSSPTLYIGAAAASTEAPATGTAKAVAFL